MTFQRTCGIRRRVAAWIILCFVSTTGATEPITLQTAGGDTRSFEKHLTGRVDTNVCDAVRVQSPSGTVLATLHGEQFIAAVPLRSGANESQAICFDDEDEVARSAVQRWTVRRADTPRAWIRVRVDGATVWMDGRGSQLAEGTPAPLTRFEWRAQIGNSAPLLLASGESTLEHAPVQGDRIGLRVPTIDGEYHTTLRVTKSMRLTPTTCESSWISFQTILRIVTRTISMRGSVAETPPISIGSSLM